MAVLTLGYVFVDDSLLCIAHHLQALCTEAALNAVQRRYPQIYKSTDRLLLKPETINVELRDFMISIKSTYSHVVARTLSANYATQSLFRLLLARQHQLHPHSPNSWCLCFRTRLTRYVQSSTRFFLSAKSERLSKKRSARTKRALRALWSVN